MKFTVFATMATALVPVLPHRLLHAGWRGDLGLNQRHWDDHLGCLRRRGPAAAMTMKLKQAMVAGATVFAVAMPASAQAEPGEPAGPCNVAPTTAQSEQACMACLKPLYPPPNQPPVTPHEAATIGWNCGMPGATNPAEVQLVDGK